MELEEIKSRNLPVVQTYEEFGEKLNEIDYSQEDFAALVTDLSSVLYADSLETVWGFIGFQWDEYNNAVKWVVLTIIITCALTAFLAVICMPLGYLIGSGISKDSLSVATRFIKVVFENPDYLVLQKLPDPACPHHCLCPQNDEF